MTKTTAPQQHRRVRRRPTCILLLCLGLWRNVWWHSVSKSMARTFDEFDRLIVQVRHLVERAMEHERRAESLVHDAERSAASGTSMSPSLPESSDGRSRSLSRLLPYIRELYVGALDQRQFSESLLRSLTPGLTSEVKLDGPLKHVLVVDDAEDSREVLTFALGLLVSHRSRRAMDSKRCLWRAPCGQP